MGRKRRAGSSRAASARAARAVAADPRDAIAALALVARGAGRAIRMHGQALIVLAGRHVLAARAADLDDARRSTGCRARIERIGSRVLQSRFVPAVIAPQVPVSAAR